MAITVTGEWWTGGDEYAVAAVGTDFTSGSATSMVTGFFGEGQAINLPAVLRKTLGSSSINAIFHARVRYDADGKVCRFRNGTAGQGPYLQVTAGVVTLHMDSGTVIATGSVTWVLGTTYSISLAMLLSTSATGSAKLWMDSTVAINVSGVATVQGGGATGMSTLELDGFGVFDDVGFIIGSGSWVDADVPLRRWVRTRYASAVGTNQAWGAVGPGSTDLDRVNETIADGDTSYLTAGTVSDLEGFFHQALPANIGSVWAVQHSVYGRTVGTFTVAFQTRDGGGAHALGGSTPYLSTYSYLFRVYRTNPLTSAAWTTNFNTTEFELFTNVAGTTTDGRTSQITVRVVGEAPATINLTPDPTTQATGVPSPQLSIDLTPDASRVAVVPLIVQAGPQQPADATVCYTVVPDVTVTFDEPPEPPPARCVHETQPAYLAQLQDLLPRGLAWTRDPEAVLTRFLAAFAAELSCVDARARTLLAETDPRTTLEMLEDWELALGLPDPCTGPLETLAERRQAVTARLANQGGASPAYFEQVLASIGYPEAYVAEYQPFVAGRARAGDRLTNPQRPFRAGQARAGDSLTNSEKWLHTWAVYAPDVSFRTFRAGQSTAGEALRTWGNAPIECVVRELAPAHTFVLFFYFQALRPDATVATLSTPAVAVT